MIVVTGTKRSGTSMWMQILQAGEIPTIGEAFSKKWKERIGDANKRGFFESPLRRGIYYATNPHPVTGKWLPPQKTQRVGAKVFIPGVVRTDVAYLSRVIASVRPFRQYVSSLSRLYSMEQEAKEKEGEETSRVIHIDPILEWWVENFLLIRDISTRRYPVRLVSYESILEEPELICDQVFKYLEVGDVKKAREAIHPEDRTQKGDDVEEVTHRFAEIFDEYHHRVKQGTPFDEAFLGKMNDVHTELLPEVEEQLQMLARKKREHMMEKRSQGAKRPPPPGGPLNVDRIDALFHPDRD
jgi:hypothetical protein